MNTFLELLVFGIATWRLSYMLVRESGPRQIFTHLRDSTRTWKLFDCLYCVSMWVAPLVYIALTGPLAPLVWIVAGSGLAIMLGSFTSANYEGPE